MLTLHSPVCLSSLHSHSLQKRFSPSDFPSQNSEMQVNYLTTLNYPQAAGVNLQGHRWINRSSVKSPKYVRERIRSEQRKHFEDFAPHPHLLSLWSAVKRSNSTGAALTSTFSTEAAARQRRSRRSEPINFLSLLLQQNLE